MTNGQLHPSVEQFKNFAKKNPKIFDEVKNGNSTLQELFEEWYLLGEEDPRWESFRSEDGSSENNVSEKTKTDRVQQILGAIKNIDANQMQQYIGNLSQALGAIQGILAQFQGEAAVTSPEPAKETPKHPFGFRKD